MHEKKNTILIVDDEEQIRKMLTIFLDSADFKVSESDNGKQAIRMAASLKPDLILLDLGLPDMDGKEVLKTLREWMQTPIIVLTACADDMEIAAGLNAGADDYITKPFSAEVLLARIHANLRKNAVRAAGEPALVNGPLSMDLVRHEVFINSERIAFTPKEYDLLRYFMLNRGRMLSHKQILKEVWGPAHIEDTQYLRVYVGQLREKLDVHPSLNKLIVSEAGVGYRLDNFPNDELTPAA